MSKPSLAILAVFLILSAVPTNSQRVACNLNPDFACSYAFLDYFPPGPDQKSMIEVMGWVFTSITVSKVGVRLSEPSTNFLYDWQYTVTSNTYHSTTVTNQLFVYTTWFSLADLPKGYYDALFGMFDPDGNLVYELPFHLIL